MNNGQHTLICVMGRSGVGKDALVNTICERSDMKQLISYTTRPRRDNEGDTHHFVTEEEYMKMKANEQVAAYTQINGFHYWSTIDQLYTSEFYIIDPNGVKTLRDLHLDNLKIITVYIHVSDEIREQRALEQRKDNKAVFRARNLSEQAQFREVERNVDFDYSINNIDFANAYSILRWISIVEGATNLYGGSNTIG